MTFSRHIFFTLLVSLACALGPPLAQAEATATTPEASMQAGTESFRRGDFTQALRHSSAAASAYAVAGNAEGQARALMRAAEAELSLGRGPDAIATLQKAQALAERTGNAPLTLAVESSLGNAYVMSGRDTSRGCPLNWLDTSRRASQPMVIESMRAPARRPPRASRSWQIFFSAEKSLQRA